MKKNGYHEDNIYVKKLSHFRLLKMDVDCELLRIIL